MNINAIFNFLDNILQRPEIKDYSETVNAIGNATGEMTIDLSLGNVVTATIIGGTNWTITNPSPTGKACSFTLILTNGGSSAQTWTVTPKWPGGTLPTFTVSGVDILVLFTVDAGTTWRGVVSCLDSK